MNETQINILLIEDNPDDTFLIQEMLAEANGAFELTHAERLSTGLERLLSDGIDVVLLDLSLPDSHGLDTFLQVHTRVPHVPIVVLSGLDDEALAIRAVRHGAQDYLVKGQADGNLLARAVRYTIERQRTEKALRASEERLRLVVQNMPVMIDAIDAEGSFVLWNRECERVTGYGADEIIGNPQAMELLYPHPERLERVTAEVADHSADFRDLEWDIKCKDGSVKTVSWANISNQVPIPGWAQWAIGVDITERVRAEKALRQLNATLEAQVAERTAEVVAEKEKSEAILHSVGDAIVMADREMRIRYVNPAFTAITGYTAQEVLGRHANAVGAGTGSAQVGQSIRQALAEGQQWRGEVVARRKDGRTYDAALTITPMRDAEGRLAGYVSSHQDISRHKELERAKNQFMANVSHELRTPVSNMKLYVHLLRKARRPEKTEGYFQVLEGQTDQLTQLIQDILEITALDSGQAVTAWEPVSLPTIITNTVTRYQSRAIEAGLTLKAMPAPPDLPTVKGDQARLSRALGELVENAVIFTPAGGQVTIETGTAETGGRRWVTIAVRDTGPGISPEEQERVFDRFFRGELAESGHIPGTGLGLSIAQEILRAHGGRVTVDSQPDQGDESWALGTASQGQSASAQGSTFKIWLPSLTVDHSPPPKTRTVVRAKPQDSDPALM